MPTCKLNDFVEILKPWIDNDYIRRVFWTDQDHLVFFFTDGGQIEYVIDDCSADQLRTILDEIRQRGIGVEKAR